MARAVLVAVRCCTGLGIESAYVGVGSAHDGAHALAVLGYIGTGDERRGGGRSSVLGRGFGGHSIARLGRR